jgi:hypothetical protein
MMRPFDIVPTVSVTAIKLSRNPLPQPPMLLRATEVGRNKPAQAGVSGELVGQMPETVASRPYSGLRLLP